MPKRLKQPHKYTDRFMEKHSEESNQQFESEQNKPSQNNQTSKEKLIQKIKKHQRKIIKKPNEPSAIRLEQINKTFQKLQAKSEHFLEDIDINKQLLQDLINQKQKVKCKCNKNVKYYCLKCMTKCTSIQFQQIDLPLKVSVIHHLSEKINKSSIAPMTFLTKDIQLFPYKGGPSQQILIKNSQIISTINRDQINLHDLFEKLPQPSDQTFVLFPHKKSKFIEQVDVKNIKNLIILDCTWFQTDQMIADFQSKGYRKYIKLKGYKSVFWRYNHHSDQALSSAEAIMHFLREYQAKMMKINNCEQDEIKRYDNLMLLYSLNLSLISKGILGSQNKEEDELKEQNDEKEEGIQDK